eukprot:snap_masked-scaffold_30-processed-gene-2.4-mRNA-1 protein AED:0.44 eAED:0.48 QI:0/-1/0/1/-1/1/1/0/172
MIVQQFILSQDKEPIVVIVNLPFNMSSSNPVRGPKVAYEVMDDAVIMEFDLNGLPPENMWFVWTIFKKRELVLKWMSKNRIKFLSRLIWVKVNEEGKILSTLGNVTGACTEEVLFGLRGQFPGTLERRFVGKEVFYGVKRWNSEKPIELYMIFEGVLKMKLLGGNYLGGIII